MNEFLKVVKETLAGFEVQEDRAFTVVDCGCGKAYLTVSLYFYLRYSLGFKNVRVVGIDRRADVIAAARKVSNIMDAEGLEFIESELEAVAADSFGGRADMVVSLHACDTATDEALAKGVEWKARFILSAPCCQHELHKALSDKREFSGLLRQSILRERLCDILTDSFRAMIMRILGFKTQVIEFVSGDGAEHSP